MALDSNRSYNLSPTMKTLLTRRTGTTYREAYRPIEDLQTMIPAIGDEQPPTGIERERMRRPELAGARAYLSHS